MNSGIIGLVFLLSLSSFAQDTNELERRKGFKDIKLESKISEIVGAEYKKDLKEKGEYPVKLYRVSNQEYESIGGIRVRSLELKVYNEKIYEIIVITDKDPRLMKSLEEAFGQASYNVRSDTYTWLAESLSLAFTSKSKKELELIYRSANIIKEMASDKKEDIKKMSSDF
jgi:hypothetical protein